MYSNPTDRNDELLIVGDYLFDPKVGLLSGPTGAHHVCARMAALISQLAEQPGEIVDRNVLLRELWQDEPSAAASLTQCVGRLRHYLGDTARTGQYIETVPGRGYRLVAPVHCSVDRSESVRTERKTVKGQPVNNRLARFILEFRERKVCRAMLIYTIVIWLLLQVSEIVVPALSLPLWVNSLVVMLGILGFPVAAVLSWIFDLTPNGLVMESPSVAPQRGGSTRNRTDLVIDAAMVAVALTISGMLVVTSLDHGTLSATKLGALDPGQGTASGESYTIAVRSFSRSGADPVVHEVSSDVTAEILRSLMLRTRFDVLARGVNDRQEPSADSTGRRADFVLEGAIKRQGLNIQISVYLLNTHTEKYIWGEVMEQPLPQSDVLAKEVSGSVLKALAILEGQDAVLTQI